jgi:hypothetical protein
LPELNVELARVNCHSFTVAPTVCGPPLDPLGEEQATVSPAIAIRVPTLRTIVDTLSSSSAGHAPGMGLLATHAPSPTG